MPPRKYSAVTIRREVYELLKEVLEEEKKKLNPRHRSMAALVEAAVIEYVRNEYPDVYLKYTREGSTD